MWSVFVIMHWLYITMIYNNCMSLWESDKVILFPVTKRNTVSSPVGVVAGQVHTITSHTWLKLYWERDTKRYSCARDFFAILLSTGNVTILCKNNTVTLESILNVSEANWAEYEITVRDFVRLTAADPNRPIHAYDDYIYKVLCPLCIVPTIRSEDNATIKKVLWINTIAWFEPDKISAIVKNGESYECYVYFSEDDPIGYSNLDSFNLTGCSVCLLDMMLSALDFAEKNGFTISWASLNIVFSGWDKKMVTTIPVEFVDDVIYCALKRKNPLYQYRSLADARKHYFENVVFRNMWKPDL